MQIMAFHYLRSALRSLWVNKGSSVINITGLTIGFTCCIIISLHLIQEFSFDRFNKNAASIFRVCYHVSGKESSYYHSHHPKELSEKLKEENPLIEKSTAYKWAWHATIKYDDKYFSELLAMAEPDFFNIFSYKLISGNPETLLKNPDEIVITEELARKLLPAANRNYSELIGQTIEFPNNIRNKAFTITGILGALPSTSSMMFHILMPLNYQDDFSQSSNDFGNTSVYIKIKKGIDINDISGPASGTILSFYQARIKELQGKNVLTNTSDCFVPIFQPLLKVYLDSNYDNDYLLQGSKTKLFILLGIGVVILLVGCCNFILLFLAQFLKNTRKVGIQKVFGAKNKDIFRYLFAEINILAFIALTAGLFISNDLLPLYSKFAQINLTNRLFHYPVIFLIIGIIYFFVVAINCLIPIILFSRIKPVTLIKKMNITRQQGKIPFVFVSLQYCVSIILIISALLIFKQVNYMKYRDLGFTSRNVLCIDMSDMQGKQRLIYRDLLKNHPGIIDVCITNRDFISGRNENYMKKENGENVVVRFIRADENYLHTLGLQLTAGSDFNPGNRTDLDNKIIVNEKLLSSLEISGDPVGKIIQSPDLPFDVSILGVVKNFHFDSMKEEIQPLALVANTRFESMNYLFVRFNEKMIAEVIPYINKTWDEIVTDRKAKISFWDEKLKARYEDEDRWAQILDFASILAIFITSLGLFGLTLLIINNRIKEIGIRKVNGMRAAEVVLMLNFDFVKWVALAFIVACPVAWYIMHKWLQGFAYKTEISWWIFALAGMIAFAIASLTVSWQSWRAATRNPVEALRYE